MQNGKHEPKSDRLLARIFYEKRRRNPVFFLLIQSIRMQGERDFAMTICSRDQLEFPGCKGRKMEAEFSGGDVTGDGGLLLLRKADRRLGLTSQVARLTMIPGAKPVAGTRRSHAAAAGLWAGGGL